MVKSSSNNAMKKYDNRKSNFILKPFLKTNDKWKDASDFLKNAKRLSKKTKKNMKKVLSRRKFLHKNNKNNPNCKYYYNNEINY